mmetsp:Transcript_35242/g.91558  ORF Transcript_35242/g.91558 Transcript_35242/m.91558 type:complete len:207 (-) Transcript_35242:3143-3763(-)
MPPSRSLVRVSVLLLLEHLLLPRPRHGPQLLALLPHGVLQLRGEAVVVLNRPLHVLAVQDQSLDLCDCADAGSAAHADPRPPHPHQGGNDAQSLHGGAHPALWRWRHRQVAGVARGRAGVAAGRPRAERVQVRDIRHGARHRHGAQILKVARRDGDHPVPAGGCGGSHRGVRIHHDLVDVRRADGAQPVDAALAAVGAAAPLAVQA